MAKIIQSQNITVQKQTIGSKGAWGRQKGSVTGIVVPGGGGDAQAVVENA